MSLRLVEGAKKLIQARVVVEASDARLDRVKKESAKMAKVLGSDGNSPYSGEKMLLVTDFPKKRWIRVVGDLMLQIPSARNS